MIFWNQLFLYQLSTLSKYKTLLQAHLIVINLKIQNTEKKFLFNILVQNIFCIVQTKHFKIF